MKAIILSLCILILSFNDVIAQGCAMCTKVATGLGEESARGLNYGIIYLGALPLLFMGIIFYKWYKNNKATQSED